LKHARIFFLLGAFLLTGCQTAQQKRLNLVRERISQLKPLAAWPSLKCDIEAHLTQPALARYEQMFAGEAKSISGDGVVSFGWRASESTCELKMRDRSAFSKSYKSLLNDVLCTLLQVHWVNSPFDELAIGRDDVMEGPDGKTRIRLGRGDSQGLFLDPKAVAVETHTGGKGVLRAIYARVDGRWLPAKLSQETGKVEISLDEFEWSDVYVEGRRMIHSFWLSVGEGEPLQHSKLVFSNCRRD
jgi:hypothetical protein